MKNFILNNPRKVKPNVQLKNIKQITFVCKTPHVKQKISGIKLKNIKTYLPKLN